MENKYHLITVTMALLTLLIVIYQFCTFNSINTIEIKTENEINTYVLEDYKELKKLKSYLDARIAETQLDAERCYLKNNQNYDSCEREFDEYQTLNLLNLRYSKYGK